MLRTITSSGFSTAQKLGSIHVSGSCQYPHKSVASFYSWFSRSPPKEAQAAPPATTPSSEPLDNTKNDTILTRRNRQSQPPAEIPPNPSLIENKNNNSSLPMDTSTMPNSTSKDFITSAPSSTVTLPQGIQEIHQAEQTSGVPPFVKEQSCRIYRPTKSAMQSGGSAGTDYWKIDFDSYEKWENPLMGWAST